MQYLPALKPATRYRLSFFVKLQDVKPLKAGGGVCANLYDDANRWFPAHNWLTGTMDWTFQSYEFTTGKNTNAKVNSYLRLRDGMVRRCEAGGTLSPAFIFQVLFPEFRQFYHIASKIRFSFFFLKMLLKRKFSHDILYAL